MPKGTLILFPNVLEETLDHKPFLPPIVEKKIFTIDGLIAESEKAARHYLKRFSFSKERTFRDIPIRLLNEHTTSIELKALLEPLEKGETWGLISDCGLPCFADPGPSLVSFARAKGIVIDAIIGPSAIILALMLSGLSGQAFCFHGYLPQDPKELTKKLQSLENNSLHSKSAQLFIEAPYRSDRLLTALLSTLKPQTRLFIAIDLMLPSEQVFMDTVATWKEKKGFTIGKKPTVFIFQS